ncbi:sugar 1,4-lactone oxidase [Phialemonium atrogriseum]|uniref:D-arabinono-1,4-lactone oxidase n=1 Tax=Phialemonium atrogriseum TaxID=1093897 RepID=A0AAJ0C250_9PEZI|nr:sugar 1,4-lactone oxidase [Phialemonium atrogriseum]KAK1768744.1 sugar 1,4-lactone oxidase [Phialemonium atrogriseum]
MPHDASPGVDLSHLPTHVRELVSSSSSAGIPFRARTQHLHSTWARTFSSLPELYIQPESLPEIEHAVSLARRCGRRITTVGSGHSPSDITCTSSWLMNLDRFDRVLDLDASTGVVTMQAGIRLFQLCDHLDAHGLAMPNLGSINSQSIAGVISTGTHGSSLQHGLISERVLSLKIVLADGRARACSPTRDPDLFRAALLSLGALGVIAEVTFQAVPAFSLRWDQTIYDDETVFAAWEARTLWSQADFVRVWWFPYMRRAVVWKADVVSSADLASGRAAHVDPPRSYYDGALGYYVYHNLLYLSRLVPRILPWVEWFVFGMQYGFRDGAASTIGAVQPSRDALLMNCLYSQYVNEWALPLDKGPSALRRLGAWLSRRRPADHGIPFACPAGSYVHSPVEVRASDSGVHTGAARANRPWLDPTERGGPTLYLNAIMYRPYGLDPPGRDDYYRGFEWLMRDLGGRPHWAKNFSATAADVEAWYGDDLRTWRRVRDEADPQGMFVGPWHRRLVLGGRGDGDGDGKVAEEQLLLPLEETELSPGRARNGGVLWRGTLGGGGRV